jgi:hypothetical protein
MKQMIRGMMVALAAMFVVTVGRAETGAIDLTKFDKSFLSASGDVLKQATKVGKAVKAGQYSEALTQLGELSKQADKFTPEQKQAVKDLTAAVKKKLTSTPPKTVNDLQKSLPLGK